MAQVRVSSGRWLGLGNRYVVQLDGQESGRLGRRTKSVTVDVDSGAHSVAVAYGQRMTPVVKVDVTDDETACFELCFPSGRELFQAVRSGGQQTTSASIMWLERC